MDNKTPRVAVVGAGGIAQGVHLPALAAMAGAELVAVCDLVPARAEAAREKFAVARAYTVFEEMLKRERPEIVFCLVEPDAMFRVALRAIQSGAAAFLEKPPGLTAYQTESLLRAAKRSGATVGVGFNRRFVPLVGEVLRRMRPLGPVHQVDGWFYKHGEAAFYDGCASAFTCDAIHTLDLLRFIARGEKADLPVRRARALASRFGDSPVDNAWNALIEFENGAVATLHSNYETGGRVHGVAIHASAASAYIDLGFGGAGCSARILYAGGDMYSLAAQGGGAPRLETLDGPAVAGSGDYYKYYGYYAEDEAFVRAVREGRPAPCPLEDALETMRLSEALARETENS